MTTLGCTIDDRSKRFAPQAPRRLESALTRFAQGILNDWDVEKAVWDKLLYTDGMKVRISPIRRVSVGLPSD